MQLAGMKFWLCHLLALGFGASLFTLLRLCFLTCEMSITILFYWFQDALDYKTHHVPLRKNKPSSELEHSVFSSRRLLFYFILYKTGLHPITWISQAAFLREALSGRCLSCSQAQPGVLCSMPLASILQHGLTGRCQQKVSDQNQEDTGKSK